MTDDVNTISSVVSAICAVIGVVIGVLGLSRSGPVSQLEGKQTLSARAFYAFLLTSSGWVLAVLSFLWIFDPFGPYITKKEYLQIVGLMVALPALLILRSGAQLLGVTKGSGDGNTQYSNKTLPPES